ncbi:hypothetical protein P7C71_g4140, partial [Lecanoromycetidae sp. Uapishka_2]
MNPLSSTDGEDGEYLHDVEKGILTINRDGLEENIDNRNVIALINDPRDGEATDDPIQKILHMTAVNSPTPESPGTAYKVEVIPASNLPFAFINANLVSPWMTSLTRSKSSSPDALLYVIISTGSGHGEAQSYFDNVVKPTFTASGIHEHAYQVHTTSSNKSITEFASAVLLPRANEGYSQTVLLLSGDGGVVDIVNAMLSSARTDQFIKPVIGLATMGTGNALANSTGLNRDFTRGMRHFFRGEPKNLPTFSATFSPGSQFLVDEGSRTEPLADPDTEPGVVYGAVVCSWALHASLVADSDTAEYRKHGAQRFQMAAKELLVPSDGSAPHVYKGKVTLFKKNSQGQETQTTLDSQEYMYTLATMVSNLEEKLTISPHSKPLDGHMRLLHFGPVSSGEVMKILGLAFQGGGHVENEAVGYEDIEGMRIDFDEPDSRWRRVCVDGKIIRVGEGGWVEVRKSAGRGVLDIVADF